MRYGKFNIIDKSIFAKINGILILLALAKNNYVKRQSLVSEAVVYIQLKQYDETNQLSISIQAKCFLNSG